MMRPKTGLLSAGAIGVLVIALGFAGWSVRQRLTTEARMATISAHTATLEGELRRASDRLAQARMARKALAGSESASPTDQTQAETRGATAAVTRSTRPTRPAGGEVARLLEMTRDNLTVQHAEEEEYRAQYGWFYGALFRRLQLSDQQATQFIDGVAKREAQFQDLLAAARSLGVSVYDESVITLSQKDTDAYLAAQRELLGDVGVKEMQRYDATMDSRHLAMGFAGMATLANEPLAPAQVERLADIIQAAAQPSPRGPFPRHFDWDRVDAGAQVMLSPTQVALFKSAEAPGIGRGGSRFIRQVNYTVLAANRAEEMARAEANSAAPGAPH